MPTSSPPRGGLVVPSTRLSPFNWSGRFGAFEMSEYGDLWLEQGHPTDRPTDRPFKGALLQISYWWSLPCKLLHFISPSDTHDDYPTFALPVLDARSCCRVLASRSPPPSPRHITAFDASILIRKTRSCFLHFIFAFLSCSARSSSAQFIRRLFPKRVSILGKRFRFVRFVRFLRLIRIFWFCLFFSFYFVFAAKYVHLLHEQRKE